MHQKIKDHACNDRGLAFAAKENLRAHHKKVHMKISVVKNFVCKDCDSVFSEQSGLIDHVKSVHM